MDFTKDQRLELNALSKLVLGSESKWQKLFKRGYLETDMEEKEELVPGQTNEDGTVTPDSTRMVKVPKLDKGMVKKFVKYHTYGSLLQLLQDMKKDYEEKKAAWEKAQAMAKLQKEVHDQASGAVMVPEGFKDEPSIR